MPRRGENITKRKDGRWEARMICGRHENGKAIYRFLYAHSYAEVKAKKQEAQSAFQTEQALTEDAQAYNAVLTAFLLSKKNTVKESTYAHYCELIDTHIRPRLGCLKIKQPSTARIERFTNDILDCGRLDGSGGLSTKSVKDILSLIRQSFKYAIREKTLSPEAISFSSPKLECKEISVLSLPEQKTLESFSALSKNPNCFGVYLCLYTGLRLGELCALKWTDVDFENALLRVSRTVSRVKNTDEKGSSKTKILISTPKTKSSIRLIPLPAVLLEAMKVRRLSAQDSDGYLLTGTAHYIEPKNYYVKYKRWLVQCGLPDYTFHALRHTFATRCMECGFDPKSLSEILGHADVNITLNRYVHPSLDSKRRQMESLMTL